MNPPEVPKQKEKQGFFRAMKKKKKKTQPVRMSYSFIYSLRLSFSTVKNGIKCSQEIVMLQPGDLFCVCIFYYYFTCMYTCCLAAVFVYVCLLVIELKLCVLYTRQSRIEENCLFLWITLIDGLSPLSVNSVISISMQGTSAKRKVTYHPKKEAVLLFHCPINDCQCSSVPSVVFPHNSHMETITDPSSMCVAESASTVLCPQILSQRTVCSSAVFNNKRCLVLIE